jgi:hypothetical protein
VSSTPVMSYRGLVADTAAFVGLIVTGNVAPDCDSGQSVASIEPAA